MGCYMDFILFFFICHRDFIGLVCLVVVCVLQLWIIWEILLIVKFIFCFCVYGWYLCSDGLGQNGFLELGVIGFVLLISPHLCYFY